MLAKPREAILDLWTLLLVFSCLTRFYVWPNSTLLVAVGCVAIYHEMKAIDRKRKRNPECYPKIRAIPEHRGQVYPACPRSRGSAPAHPNPARQTDHGFAGSCTDLVTPQLPIGLKVHGGRRCGLTGEPAADDLGWATWGGETPVSRGRRRQGVAAALVENSRTMPSGVMRT